MLDRAEHPFETKVTISEITSDLLVSFGYGMLKRTKRLNRSNYCGSKYE